ncbi:MAG: ROK family protein [Bacteroidales bacterium]|nr:ROK family protein [Bacteroidales bacterium]
MKIGVDLGGTNVRAALVDGTTVIRKEKAPCPAKGTQEEVIEAIAALIEPLICKEVTSIGMGVPSVVDTKRGIVYNVANIPSWQEVHLKDIFEERFGIPVHINNDANCFALGESRFGQGRGYKDVVGVTLGTGVGSGIIIGGHLYEGRNAGAGEIGCLSYLDKDYESYCSTPFFVAHNTSGAELAAKAQAGDAQAQALWDEFGHHIGELVKAVLFAYDPEAIIFGGGIAAGHPYFAASMHRTVQTFPYETAKDVKILFSEDGDMGLYGASVLDEK